MNGARQKNLVLIRAREFASKLATAMFINDDEGRLIYYNEPAEAIVGRTFSEAGEMAAEEWADMFSTEELDGSPLPLERIPGGIALLERRPAHHTFRMTGLDGVGRILSVTAFPLFAFTDDLVGVVNIFWELPEQ